MIRTLCYSAASGTATLLPPNMCTKFAETACSRSTVLPSQDEPNRAEPHRRFHLARVWRAAQVCAILLTAAAAAEAAAACSDASVLVVGVRGSTWPRRVSVERSRGHAAVCRRCSPHEVLHRATAERSTWVTFAASSDFLEGGPPRRHTNNNNYCCCCSPCFRFAAPSSPSMFSFASLLTLELKLIKC